MAWQTGYGKRAYRKRIIAWCIGYVSRSKRKEVDLAHCGNEKLADISSSTDCSKAEIDNHKWHDDLLKNRDRMDAFHDRILKD